LMLGVESETGVGGDFEGGHRQPAVGRARHSVRAVGLQLTRHTRMFQEENRISLKKCAVEYAEAFVRELDQQQMRVPAPTARLHTSLWQRHSYARTRFMRAVSPAHKTAWPAGSTSPPSPLTGPVGSVLGGKTTILPPVSANFFAPPRLRPQCP
jgi:hypothetical protein